MRLRAYGVVMSLAVLVAGILPLVIAEAQPAPAAAAVTSADAATPAAKPLLTGVKLVVADAYSTCALLLTGAIDCWGGNAAG
jgi:hypothetical protein